MYMHACVYVYPFRLYLAQFDMSYIGGVSESIYFKAETYFLKRDRVHIHNTLLVKETSCEEHLS